MSEIATLTPTLDAYMKQEAPDTAASGLLPIGEDNTFAELFRSAMVFDLSSIPAGSTVSTAVLTMTLSAAGSFRSSNNRIMRAYRLRRGFTSGMTWNKYDGTNLWSTAGASNTTTDREATDVGSLTTDTTWLIDTAHNFNLTASAVEDWINGDFTNNGILLQMDTESSDRYHWYNRGAVTEADRPTLVVTYELPPSSPLMTMFSGSVAGAI